MFRILSASKDTYITDKIINNRFRATDANLGQAGTLDLFKLYNESTISGESLPIELSRLLIKFDLSEVTNMHNDKFINVGDNSFKAEIKLHDIYGGQTTPSNFHVICFPLSQSFDEGTGFDVVNYQDVSTTNWLTASYVRGVERKWNKTGATASGSLGDSNIDVIVSGTIKGQSSPINLSSEMYFETGEEDLILDVTSFVSASVKNLVDNHGFLIAFSGSYEKDNKSYFVKRFASRNTLNANIRPKLIIKFDDSISDNLVNFEFDTTGSLYLHNFNRGNLSNLLSGSAATEVTGENCMILKIQSGSFSKQFDVSQVLRGPSTKSTATITFSDKPNEGTKITLTDTTGASVTFEVDDDNDGASDATQATAEWIFIEKPNETSTITITDYEGTSIVFEVDDDNNGTAGSNIAINPSTGDGPGMAAEMVSVINASDLKITATNPESGKVVLTQNAGAAAGNKTITFSDRANWVASTEPDVPTSFTGGAAGSIIPMNPAAGTGAGMATIMASSVNASALKITATNPESGKVVLTQDNAGPLGDLTIENNFNNATVPASFSAGAFSGLTGIYSSSFAISSFDSSLYDHVIATGSVTFNQIWSNSNETVAYLSSSLKIKKSNRNILNFGEQRVLATIMNLRPRYKNNEKVRLRVFVENANKELVLRKKPVETPSEIYSNMFYRVRDADTDDIIIPFDTSGTKLSNDSKAMYFDFYMSSLTKGKAFTFDFLIKENNFDLVVKSPSKFIIE